MALLLHLGQKQKSKTTSTVIEATQKSVWGLVVVVVVGRLKLQREEQG